MSFKKPFFPVLILITAFLTGCEKEAILHDVDAGLEELMAEYNLPSLSAGIILDNTVVWNEHKGIGNRETGKEADEETIYHIASVSKLFIATAVMQLEEQGKIDLDEDVNAYLPIDFRHPDFPEIRITVRMLLTHTAGLSWPQSYDGDKGMWSPFEPDQGPRPSEWVPEYLIPSGKHFDPALWKNIEPGAYEFYSNIGSCVAAYVVEQVSGKNFRQYCRDHIFDPLEMTKTSYRYSDLDQDDIAVMYDQQNTGTEYFDNRLYAAGGVKTTIRDLGRFARCMLNRGELDGHRVLQEKSVDRVLEIQNPASGRCLAWKAYPGDWFGHTGGLLMGTTATFMIHPQKKAAIIIFTNAHTGVVLPGGDLFWLIKQKLNGY